MALARDLSRLLSTHFFPWLFQLIMKETEQLYAHKPNNTTHTLPISQKKRQCHTSCTPRRCVLGRCTCSPWSWWGSRCRWPPGRAPCRTQAYRGSHRGTRCLEKWKQVMSDGGFRGKTLHTCWDHLGHVSKRAWQNWLVTLYTLFQYFEMTAHMSINKEVGAFISHLAGTIFFLLKIPRVFFI